MPFTGRLIQRFSARWVCAVGSIGRCLFLTILPLLSDTMAFAGVLLLIGVCYGMWNVSMNVHGAAVERVSAGPHAAFTVREAAS